MNESIKEALEIISKRLSGAGINWAVVGSTNLALQGISVEPGDIDIVTDSRGAKIIQKELKDFLIKPYHKRLTRINLKFGIRSYAYFSSYDIRGVKVETITNMKIKNEPLDYSKEDIVLVNLREKLIPCLSLEKIKKAYQLGENREKLALLERK